MALSRKCNWYTMCLLLLVSFSVMGQDEDFIEEPAATEKTATEKKPVSQQDEYLETDIEPKPFDRETWNKNREGMGYGETPVKKKPKEKPKEETGDGDEAEDEENHENSSTIFPSGVGPIFQVLLIGGIILLLAFLVFLLIKQGWLTGNKKIKDADGKALLLDDIEDNLHESDLERALRQALENNDYRMAIRIYYLTIIKELSFLQWIQWKRDKTNGQYVREMNDRPNSGTFKQLTNAFERVWYSDENIVQRHYDVLSPQFQSFINSLKKR
ncbi:hypothetical protein BH09BAC1_BH09BAC1_04690 [soil metagenome]